MERRKLIKVHIVEKVKKKLMQNLAILLLVSLSSNGLASILKYEVYDVDNAEFHFKRFMKQFGKSYESNEEYQYRLGIFKDDLVQINKFNEQSDTAVYGINHLSDMTSEEIKHSYLGAIGNFSSSDVEDVVVAVTAPESLDFRQNGWVTEVKDQNPCGSCYVFAAIGDIEGQHAKKHGQLFSLSEQQGLDCDDVDSGCNGGIAYNVMNALAREGGAVPGKSYPYQARKGQCRTDKSQIVVRVTSGRTVRISDEEQLKNFLYQHGPLAIQISATPSIFKYRSGIADGNDCYSGAPADHAVLLVGYGTDRGVPYWLIKNSWNTSYGERGYLRLVRGQRKCSILDAISVSEVA